jgi:hypothetical protein
MYLRTIKRRNKDGSEVSYVQLAHNVWDPVKRQSRARVIHSFEEARDAPVMHGARARQ